MEAISIIKFLIIELLSFSVGFIIGKIIFLIGFSEKCKKSVKKDKDWMELLYYTPGERPEDYTDLNRNK